MASIGDAEPSGKPMSRMAELAARINRPRSWELPLAGRICRRVVVDRSGPPLALWFLYDGPRAYVEVNSPFRLRVGDEEWQLDPGAGHPGADRRALGPVLSLVGLTVVSAISAVDGSLHIEFEGGGALEVAEDDRWEPWYYSEEPEGPVEQQT